MKNKSIIYSIIGIIHYAHKCNPHKKHRHKVNAKIISTNYKTTTRSPLFL